MIKERGGMGSLQTTLSLMQQCYLGDFEETSSEVLKKKEGTRVKREDMMNNEFRRIYDIYT